MSVVLINDVLKKFDFNLKSDDSTLFFTSQEYDQDKIFFEERLILESAKKLNASAVYFRRFSENQSSKPQLFIFDNTTNIFSKKKLAELHRKIWSSGIVPIYYVFDNTNINIFDGRKQVDYNEKSKTISVEPFDVISIVSDSHKIYQKYSAKLFLNGSFWEQKIVKNNFLSKESSENKLIDGLKKVRSHFINDTELETGLAQQLLVLSILVKYLEERQDDLGNHVFPSDYFKKYNSLSLCDVLRCGKIVELFDDLSSHFNGQIFELKKGDKKVLNNTDLRKLADYLDAKLDNNQMVLWPLYSFDYLPVELISRIYEEFIDQRDDAVFTPIHLTRLMVDECMPISDPKSNFKVIDVSCGSGIFLVAVFKRLVEWWQKEQFEKTGQLFIPNAFDLKEILSNSIYGVDIEETSVRLSVFSISIALCDMLTPTEIWTELRFDNLRENNIYEGNFFKYLNECESKDFDLVIGNPPFEDKFKGFKSLLSEFNITCEYRIPRNQIAMLFLQQAMKLLKPNGLLSLVMPSGPLLYNNTLKYRENFFSRYKVPQIIDLSELREAGTLFEKTVSTAVIFAYNSIPNPNDEILHVTVKRTKSIKEKLFFEIDSYDIHSVSQDIAKNNLLIWKSNLIGGNQLFYLINRFNKIRTLGEYLDEKERLNNWSVSLGYQIAKRTDSAPHLTGKLMVESKDFKAEGILKTKIETETKFQWSREPSQNVYLAPHLLIKRTIGKDSFIMHYLDYDLIFKERIIGIHAPKGQEHKLKSIKSILNTNYSFYKLFLLSISAEAGISRSGGYVIYMKDIKSLPYSENLNELELSPSEKIIKNDVLDYKLEELTKGEKSKINISNVSKTELNEFGKVFCESLNPIYKNNNLKFKPLEPIETISFTCFPFAYGNSSIKISKKIKAGDLSELIENQVGLVKYRRVLRLYQKNVIYLVKPNTLRYWLKSVALRDANDVMADLLNSGF